MTDWQPIETAPKDSVLILGWWADVLGSVSWEIDIEYWGDDELQQFVTHWMPLPPPPEPKP